MHTKPTSTGLNDLPNRFADHWQKNFANHVAGQLLLAVSGGMDSMALAHLLQHVGVHFAIAHCNFGLRGAEADADEQLVRDWCTANSIHFHSIRFETKKRAEELKAGTQETARILRYEWFSKMMAEHGYTRTATAHHANDNAETVLLNLFRGTGIRGLHGILPDNGTTIRPLLFATRAEIADYVLQTGIAYREDASNASDDYTRNSIRHQVIPAAEKMFPNAVANMNETISRVAEAELLYRSAVDKACSKLVEQRGKDLYIPILKLQKEQAIDTLLFEITTPFGFVSAQVPAIRLLLGSETGRLVQSATHRIIRNRDFLVITAKATTDTDLITIEELPATVVTGTHRFTFSLGETPSHLPTDINVAILDARQAGLPMLLRKKRTGDYMYPLGMGMKKKKVSRMLVDAKVALHEKENVWVVESNKRIAWLAGMRLDERFKVTDATKNVITITMEPLTN